MPGSERIRGLVSAAQSVVLRLNRDVVRAAFVLASLCRAAKAIIKRLSLQGVIAIVCLVTGRGDDPISIIVSKGRLALDWSACSWKASDGGAGCDELAEGVETLESFDFAVNAPNAITKNVNTTPALRKRLLLINTKLLLTNASNQL